MMNIQILLTAVMIGAYTLVGCTSTTEQLNSWQLTEKKIQAAYQRGDLEHTESLLRRHLRNHKNDSDAWFMLGQVQLKNHEYLAAQRAFHTAVRLKPDQAANWEKLASSYLRLATEALIEADSKGAGHDARALLHHLLELQIGQPIAWQTSD